MFFIDGAFIIFDVLSNCNLKRNGGTGRPSVEAYGSADRGRWKGPLRFLSEKGTTMIYTALTKKAMKLAYDAHHGQTDKAGLPYIFHPCHLAEQMTDETSVCVALLHNVAEDAAVTFEDLEREFPTEVTEALRLLTHQQGTDYDGYVRALAKNPVAKAVKLADLAHNSDETRLAGCLDVNAETLVRLRKKYAHARAILLEDRSEPSL